jgi:hypothetical protein
MLLGLTSDSFSVRQPLISLLMLQHQRAAVTLPPTLISARRLHNLCEKVESNTRLYVRIIAEVVVSLLDMLPARDDVADKDGFDVMICIGLCC